MDQGCQHASDQEPRPLLDNSGRADPPKAPSFVWGWEWEWGRSLSALSPDAAYKTKVW